ncbi:MAG: hypothetical protein ABI638_07815 [Ignavibacteriota bacterium]
MPELNPRINNTQIINYMTEDVKEIKRFLNQVVKQEFLPQLFSRISSHKQFLSEIVIHTYKYLVLIDNLYISSEYSSISSIIELNKLILEKLESRFHLNNNDSLVSIPNGDIMNCSVSNSNAGEANCQVVAEIYLPISVDTEKVRQIATEAAQVSKYVYLNKPITVLFFNEINERRSYLKMRL